MCVYVLLALSTAHCIPRLESFFFAMCANVTLLQPQFGAHTHLPMEWEEELVLSLALPKE